MIAVKHMYETKHNLQVCAGNRPFCICGFCERMRKYWAQVSSIVFADVQIRLVLRRDWYGDRNSESQNERHEERQ